VYPECNNNDNTTNNNNNNNKKQDLSPKMKKTLDKLYSPFNKRLFELLGWDAKEIGW